MSPRHKVAPLPMPRPDQIAALRAYAVAHGRAWKHDLNMAWYHASAPALLHQLRNSHGPSWLHSLSLDSLPTEAVHSDLRGLLIDARDAMAAAEAQLVMAVNGACQDPRCFDNRCPKRAAILRMREVSERIDATIVATIEKDGSE